ncbi:hypothetical protein V6N12_042438 [Hibiscus sabdariffa]|uniref:Uncharacterized protein n=1 Tax=Hibiscus sabdariffa TaxID=183260 RepID=A0ABR2EES1_9ROSI
MPTSHNAKVDKPRRKNGDGSFLNCHLPCHHSNAALDAFDWNTLAEHAYQTPDANILETSNAYKRKAGQATSPEKSASLDLSTSIDTTNLEELTPTRIQPDRPAKR